MIGIFLWSAAWVTSSENVVELSEDGGWVDTETGESASRLAILRTLSTLAGDNEQCDLSRLIIILDFAFQN